MGSVLDGTQHQSLTTAVTDFGLIRGNLRVTPQLRTMTVLCYLCFRLVSRVRRLDIGARVRHNNSTHEEEGLGHARCSGQ